jgi:hypothetical protein
MQARVITTLQDEVQSRLLHPAGFVRKGASSSRWIASLLLTVAKREGASGSRSIAAGVLCAQSMFHLRSGFGIADGMPARK